ncbi:unnamed protein product [Brassica oleracea var. botrytis]
MATNLLFTASVCDSDDLTVSSPFIGRSDADLMKPILPLRICRWDHRVRGVYDASRLR